MTTQASPRLYTVDLSDISPAPVSDHLDLGGSSPTGETIAFNSFYMLRNGKPCVPVMGEFHFSRYASAYWEEELVKIKAGGVNIVATYVFWIHIEEEEGVFDWSDSRNLRRFVELCGKHGLDALVRIGPFAHGECRNGGIPDWLYGRPFEIRSNDERYLAYVARLYKAIAAQLDGLLFKDGGPVIGIQLDNEYMHCGAPWETTYKQGTEWVPAGSEGIDHILKLKQLARDAGLDVPIYSCTGWLRSPIPESGILPMHGGYTFTPWSPDPNYRQPPTREFLFRNRHLHPVLNGEPTYDAARFPYVCCEIGGGIEDTYYHRNLVPPEAVEALMLMNLAGGANIVGYYMYHGGSNPVGKHSYLNEFTVPRISYDFQAPLREFGQFAASYRSLRLYHTFLSDFGDLLAPMTVSLPEDAAAITPDDTTNLRFSVRSKDGAGFLFLNNYQDHVEMEPITGIRFHLQSPELALEFPHLQTLTLEKDASAVLPFGMSLNGVKLRYATTQLFTKIVSHDATTYVFFAPRGMVSEYAFDASTYVDLSVAHGEATNVDGITYVTIEAGLHSYMTMSSHDGKQIRILTLTREEAEQAGKIVLNGRETLVVSNAMLVNDMGRWYAYHVGQAPVTLDIYPPLETRVILPVGISAVTEGDFTRCTITVPQDEKPLPIRYLAPDRAVVQVSRELLEGVNNRYLRVTYRGDIASGYMNGKLVADQFFNGSVWEIGLKQLLERGTGDELLIVVTPIRKSSTVQTFVPTGMAFTVTENESLGVIDSITCVAEYKIPLPL